MGTNPKNLKNLVAITTFNNAGYTQLFFESLFNNCKQLLKNDYKFIVYDDNSSDHTREVVYKYGIEFVRNVKPTGLTFNWNVAYKKFKNENYHTLFIINNDILLPSDNSIQLLVQQLNTGVVLVVPLTTSKGCGHSRQQNVNDYITTPTTANNIKEVQATLEKKYDKAGLVELKTTFSGFFFGMSRNIVSYEYSQDTLFNPNNINIHQESDLMSRLRRKNQFPKLCLTSYVFHYKGISTNGVPGKDRNDLGRYHKMDRKTIITMTAWRRPQYLAQVLESLKQCKNVDAYQIYLSVDGGHLEQQREIAAIVKNSDLNIRIWLQKRNWGCAKNTWKVIETAFRDGAEQIIHLEDDTLVAKDFLLFMDTSLNHYRSNLKVFNIAGHNSSNKVYKKDEWAQRLEPHHCFSCWGWATWKRVWDEVRNNWFGITWKTKLNSAEIPQGEKFLTVVNKTDKGSWAWPMNMYHRKTRYEVRPLVSRIRNIGEHNGTFAKPEIWAKKNKNKVWMDSLNLAIPSEYLFPII